MFPKYSSWVTLPDPHTSFSCCILSIFTCTSQRIFGSGMFKRKWIIQLPNFFLGPLSVSSVWITASFPSWQAINLETVQGLSLFHAHDQVLLFPNHLVNSFHNSDTEDLLLDHWHYRPLQTLISSVQPPHHSLRGLSKPHTCGATALPQWLAIAFRMNKLSTRAWITWDWWFPKVLALLFPTAPARTPGRKKKMKLGEAPWLLMINWDISMPLTNLLDTPTFSLFCFNKRQWRGWIRLSLGASLVAQMVENLPAMQEIQVRSLGWEEPLEKEMGTHSSVLAWRILWTEEPGWI